MAVAIPPENRRLFAKNNLKEPAFLEGVGLLGCVFSTPKPETLIFVVFHDLEMTPTNPDHPCGVPAKRVLPAEPVKKFRKFSVSRPRFSKASDFSVKMHIHGRSRNAIKKGFRAHQKLKKIVHPKRGKT